MSTAKAPETAGPAADSVIFSIVMALAAYLGRENPDFIYPHILWAFMVLLGFNLSNFLFLSKRLEPSRRAALAVAFNSVVIALIIQYSGASQSYFWVMYLLPIFTASIHFERRGILATTLGLGVLVLLSHLNSEEKPALSDFLEMAVKMMALAASAAATTRVAMRERRTRLMLEQEHDRATRERLEMREQLQHMDRLATMGTLSASIAHEINGPISSITLALYEIGECAPTPEKMAKLVPLMQKNADRCRATVESMLAFARKNKTERHSSDINALIKECVALKQYDWRGGKISVEESYAADLPPVPVSGPELQQVVFNLLTNAEQAIALRPAREGRIRIRTEKQADGICAVVEDDGPGIAPEIADKIWEPFFTTKPAGQGTGLGLAICKQIIEGQGGRLTLNSPAKSGAAFRIQFPVEKISRN